MFDDFSKWNVLERNGTFFSVIRVICSLLKQQGGQELNSNYLD